MEIYRDNCGWCGKERQTRCPDCGAFACGACQRQYHQRCGKAAAR